MLAQIDFNNINIPRGSGPVNPFSTATNLGGIVGSLIPYFFTTAGILLLLYFILGGFDLMVSAGDPKKAQSANGKITGALVGFVIVFSAYWIVQLTANLLGIQVIKDIFKFR